MLSRSSSLCLSLNKLGGSFSLCKGVGSSFSHGYLFSSSGFSHSLGKFGSSFSKFGSSYFVVGLVDSSSFGGSLLGSSISLEHYGSSSAATTSAAAISTLAASVAEA